MLTTNENLEDILNVLGVKDIHQIKRISETVWDVGGTYILKRSADSTQLTKSAVLSKLLREYGILAAEYYLAADGRPYVAVGNSYYCLMRKISGEYMDPYVGDRENNGETLGKILADLHVTLKKIEDKINCDDADYEKELSWMKAEIQKKKLPIREKILSGCTAFASLYSSLPRQLIHRDVHIKNLLFNNNKFSGWLDFDISQRNARTFDLCYLGASLLVGNYQNEQRLAMWREIFMGAIKGYEHRSPLLKKEKEMIPHIFILIELTFAVFFSTIGQPDVSLSCVDMLNWLYDNKLRVDTWQNE